ncbi:GntR family transcriptional regulator [Clostridia bacterium]|nr:GntR family transcriptional regulator [Clostridia bacterium]
MAAINIDLRIRTPIYEQIITRIKEMAVSGILKPDEQIPSIRQLTQELGINPNTVAKAYAELERQNIIYSLAGRGSFITSEATTISALNKAEILSAIQTLIEKAFRNKIEKSEITNITDRVYDEKLLTD